MIQQPASTPALLVPTTAIETVAGTSRAYVIKNDKVEERVVTVGETVGQQVEITSGLTKDDTVAVAPKGHLSDGLDVRTGRTSN
jgi:multidrug efflux pump subunit AcrA (membrane-fusion protein)